MREQDAAARAKAAGIGRTVLYETAKSMTNAGQLAECLVGLKPERDAPMTGVPPLLPMLAVVHASVASAPDGIDDGPNDALPARQDSLEMR